jgi:exopolysaccharide biosynthesis polyprenyl glycosylphosphotransferase
MEVEALQTVSTTLKNKDRKAKAGDRPGSKLELIGFTSAETKRKRYLDIFILVVIAPIIIPLSLIVALIIKLDSRGPVLFTQKRIGRNGEPFTMYKFRSMALNSEGTGCKFAKENDHRITNFGKFIRRYRIDEIPQFLNVLKGEMSVIGPRPEQAKFVELFNEEIHQYRLRHAIKPGITGFAQVNHGYTATTKETETKLSFDLFYIRNYSLKMDFVIIAKTIKTILTGFGAR